MEVKNFDLKKVRKAYEKYQKYDVLENLVYRVIDDLITNGSTPNFKWDFFKKMKINFAYLQYYEDDKSINLEELLYEFVKNEVEPKDKIINLALRKCKWHYLVELVNKGLIPIEYYEKQIMISLPNCTMESLFNVDELNLNKVKRYLYDEIKEKEFLSFGFYHLFVLFIVNTPYDKYNLAFAQKMSQFKNDEINYLILDTLKYFAKKEYGANIADIPKIIVNNYEILVSERPDILLLSFEFMNRLNNENGTMNIIYQNYLEEEKVSIITEKIASGEEKKVAFYLNSGILKKSSINYIIKSWLKNGNSLAISIYFEFFEQENFVYDNVGEKLDQQYIVKSNELALKRKKVKK